MLVIGCVNSPPITQLFQAFLSDLCNILPPCDVGVVALGDVLHEALLEMVLLRLVHSLGGHTHMTSTKVSDFLTPFPCLHSSAFTRQPPLLDVQFCLNPPLKFTMRGRLVPRY